VLEVDQHHPAADDATGNPFRTIQAAIDVASPSDTVHVAAGVYVERVVISRPLTLKGSGADLTILDGAQSGTVVRITDSAAANLIGLTIRNGRAMSGGGVLASGWLYVSNCVVTANTADGRSDDPADFNGYSACGGGISVSGVCLVVNSVISSNSARGGSASCPLAPYCDEPSGIGRGGGIYAAGNLFVSASSISANSASGGNRYPEDNSGTQQPLPGLGGGIFAGGILRMGRSDVEFNSAVEGGGIYSSTHAAIADGSLIRSNTAESGGGVFAGGPLWGAYSTFAGNVARGADGANGGNGTVATSSREGRGGAVYSVSSFDLFGCLLEGNLARGGDQSGQASGASGKGGGVYARIADRGHFMRLDTCAIAGNIAEGGGGDYGDGDGLGGGVYAESHSQGYFALFVLCSTLSGNRAAAGRGWAAFSPGGALGGGLYVGALGSTSNIAELAACTFAENYVEHHETEYPRDHPSAAYGGGIAIWTQDVATVRLTMAGVLVANNRSSLGSPDCFGSFERVDNCLVLTTDGWSVAEGAANLTMVAPCLGPLRDNGGPTPTHALLPGSPAIDAAACDPDMWTDQRGFQRPFGAACDIGAYEVQRGEFSHFAVDLDFDGDLRADLAVFWPPAGDWFVLLSAADALFRQRWGWDKVTPVPADYDGDGKADVAVYDRASGTWYIRQSACGALRKESWGWSDAMPVRRWITTRTMVGATWRSITPRAATGTFPEVSTNGLLRQRQWGWARIHSRAGRLRRLMVEWDHRRLRAGHGHVVHPPHVRWQCAGGELGLGGGRSRSGRL
jgi:hypothetical protein